jgi:UDP-N-acetylglucosamine--N-acetylmuramyl-(pentapeptide) pyrophosphoryl-undecaprenol N-acetylglucosamine transferase
MKILITGGHITPALSVIEELKKRGNTDIVVIGRKYNGHKSNGLSFEYQSVSKEQVKFIHLEAGRLNRTISIANVIHVIKFIPGLLKSFYYVFCEKPNIILSFGGYIALPIAIAGFLLRIPVYTHEQTMIPGLTTKILAHFAKKVFVSFPETQSMFKDKSIVSGNPLRLHVFKSKLEKEKKRQIIYVTGGSLGSHSLNVHIEHIAAKLLHDYDIIHQTGDSEYKDYERLSNLNLKHYTVVKHILADEIGSIYQKADLIISRSGANTTFELIALEKPSILVPLPWSANGEQQAHAQLLESKGVAHIFSQYGDSDKLYELIVKMMHNLSHYKESFKTVSSYYKPNAASIIVDTILDTQ